MSQKLGIFRRFQSEILELINDGVGYTEIGEMIQKKYGLRATKQNLKQSHQKYLENESKIVRDKAKKAARKNVPKTALNEAPKRATKGAKMKSKNWHDPAPARRQKVILFLEFRALLEREQATGRFSNMEAYDLETWGTLLFGLHSPTCVDVFRACHGGDFLSYEQAVFAAMNAIANEGLYESEEAFEPTPEELVNCLCIFATEEGEVTTLADRIPNFRDAIDVARKEADEERQRLGGEGFISL